MDDYDVPKPFSPNSDSHSNVSSESLCRTNSPPSTSSETTDIYDRPPSRSRSSCGSGLNVSAASAGGAAGGAGSLSGSVVSGIGGGFEGSPCKLSSTLATTMTSSSPAHQHHHHHHLMSGNSASSFNLVGSNSSFLGSGLSLADFRASESSLPPLPLDATSSYNDESIYDSPAASTTTALSPTRSIGCISNRSSSSEMLLLGASSSDLKGSLNTIPEGKELRTIKREEDSQPDYDVPLPSRRAAAASAAAGNDASSDGEKPALPQRNQPSLHPGVRAEKAQTLPASYLDEDYSSTNRSPSDKKHSTLLRKSSHESHDLPPSYQPQSNSHKNFSSSSSSSSSEEVAMEIPVDADSAIELLERLREDVKTSANKLLTFIGFSWRSKEELEPKIFEIEQACIAVMKSLKVFVDFALGIIDRVAFGASSKSSSSALKTKLKKKLAPLQVALESVTRSMDQLNKVNWQADTLIQPSPVSATTTTTISSSSPKDTDALDRIVSVSRVVLEEVSSVAVVIQGNASLIFDKSESDIHPRPLPPTPSSSPPGGSSKPPLKPKPTVASSITTTTSSPSSSSTPDGVANRPLPQLPPGAPPTTPHSRPLPDVPRDRQTERLTASAASLRSGANSPSPRSSPRASPLPRRPSLGRELDIDTYASSASPPPLPPPSSLPGDDTDSADPLSSTADVNNHDDVDQKVLNLNLQNIQQSLASSEVSSQQNPPLPPQSAIDELDAFIKEHSIANGGIIIEANGQNGVSQNGERVFLSSNDQKILNFYSTQITSLHVVLGNAIETFFQSVDNNDGPKHFIAHSKIVVLSGHKLVYIGDTLHRNIFDAVLKSRIAHCANGLCDSLKHVVTSTKRAALQYPAVATLQQMVDTVVQVSHAAHQLKRVIMMAGEAAAAT